MNSDAKYKEYINKLCDISIYDNPNLKIIEYLFKKESPLVIVPMQDYLAKDNCSRMNTPSTAYSNWQYRMDISDMSFALSNVIKDLVRKCDR